jgi:putative endonuclease
LLARQGWTVHDRNWRCKAGELDLVVGRGGILRFVEVKLRDEDDLAGLEGINLRRVHNAAEVWLANYTDVVDEACLMLAWVKHQDGAFTVEFMVDP